MTNRTSPVRRHSRFPVRWPVLYGCEEFLAEGTVLDLTHIGWRVTGSMPVTPGMQLTLQLCVPDKQKPVRIERATVLWVKNYEFAIEAREMAPIDQAWVTEFLNGKLGLPWISGVAEHRTLPQKIDADSRGDASVEHNQPARRERAIRAFLSGPYPDEGHRRRGDSAVHGPARLS